MQQDKSKTRPQQDEEPGTQQHSQKPAEGDEQTIDEDLKEKLGGGGTRQEQKGGGQRSGGGGEVF